MDESKRTPTPSALESDVKSHDVVWRRMNFERVWQVWFAGNHSDVGGSYDEIDLQRRLRRRGEAEQARLAAGPAVGIGPFLQHRVVNAALGAEQRRQRGALAAVELNVEDVGAV